MKDYGFEVAHDFEISKGWVRAETEEQAIKMILSCDWIDILDSFDTEIFTEGYEILDIWEMY